MRKRMKVLPYVCIMLAIIGSMVLGINIRNGWKDDTNLREYLHKDGMIMVSSDQEEDISFLSAEEVNSFDKLCRTADVVVRVRTKPQLKRIMYTQCTLTTLEVLDVYQGEVLENTISVFEPAYVNEDAVISVGAYQLMEDGKEYILFLKRIEYDLYPNGSSVYIPTTTSLSKYQCRKSKAMGETAIVSAEEEISYSKVFFYDAVVPDKQLKTMYDYYKEQIQKLIGGAAQ